MKTYEEIKNFIEGFNKEPIFEERLEFEDNFDKDDDKKFIRVKLKSKSKYTSLIIGRAEILKVNGILITSYRPYKNTSKKIEKALVDSFSQLNLISN